MADDGVVITEKELETLKYEVLTENIDEISSQLGDPGRYFATFKAKNLLDQSDCESIKGQVTSIEKAMHFVELISKRTGRNGEHSYDVFVGVLKRMRIHIHIVRILNQALAKKRAELKVKKRNVPPDVMQQYNHSTGFLSNSVPAINDKGLHTKMISSSPSSSSSPPSSHATTPSSHTSQVASPQNETDASLTSSRSSLPSTTSSRISSSEFPPLPEGYNEAGDQITYLSHGTSETSDHSMTTSLHDTPTTSEIDPECGPIPILPQGFNYDGSRQDSISTVVGSIPNEFMHPDIGPIPAIPPQQDHGMLSNGTSGMYGEDDTFTGKPPFRSYTAPTMATVDDSILMSLKQKVQSLELDNESLSQRNEYLENKLQELDTQLSAMNEDFKRLRAERDKLVDDKERLISLNKRLESHISVLQQGKLTTPVAATPNRFASSPNFYIGGQMGGQMSGTPNYNGVGRRGTEPYFRDPGKMSYHHQRTSDPSFFIPVPSQVHFQAGSRESRPKNLPLGIPPSINNHMLPSPNNGGLMYPPSSMIKRQSPGSDVSANYHKISSSADDLTSGEDQSSVRSFDSNHSGKITVELSSVGNTHETVV